MMAPSGGTKGRGGGAGSAPQSYQAYQDFSNYEDDGPIANNFGVSSGYGGEFKFFKTVVFKICQNLLKLSFFNQWLNISTYYLILFYRINLIFSHKTQ
jgi:hypothetical protein